MRIRFARTALLLLVLLAGCGRSEEWDQLARAHKRLEPAGCGAEPAVSGVASVNTDPHEVFLGDWVVISVCHMNTLIAAAAAEQQPLTLFVNGVDTKVQPSGFDHDNGNLTFTLDRNDANKDLWRPLLYGPLFDRSATLYVSVGIHGGKPLPRAGQANMLLRLNKLYVDPSTYVWLALLVALVWALFALAHRSDMLREGPNVAGVRRPYSLARTQMAWWFFLTIVSYVLIWLVTSDQDTIPPSLLGMLGISAATALAAVAVDSGDSMARRRALFDAEITAVELATDRVTIDLSEAEAKVGLHADALRTALSKRLADLQARRMELEIERSNLLSPQTQGWWRDLVTDERGGFALDRFQVVAWTVVMGGIFVSSVLWELTMPEFSATQLALMGISSGTYIGFKLPQKS